MRLKHVKVNLCDLCNLRCQFCPRGNPEIYPNNNQHMTMETFRKIIDDLEAVEGKFYFEIAGHGEPTVAKNFQQAARELYEAKKKYPNMVTRVVSNGAKFDKYPHEMTLFDEIVLDVYTDDEDEWWDTLRKYQHLNILNCQMVNSVGKLRMRYDGNTKEVIPMNGEMLLLDRTGKFEIPLLGPINPPKHGKCVRPTEDITIIYNGDYIVCCEDWNNESIGNVHEQSLEEFYNTNETFVQYRRKTQEGIREGVCTGCSYPGNNRYMAGYKGSSGDKGWMHEWDEEWKKNIEERLKKQAALPDFPVDIKVE